MARNPGWKTCELLGAWQEQMPLCRPISLNVRTLLAAVDVVLLDLTTSSHDVLETIRDLVSVIGICMPRPRLLCFSSAHRNPHFVLGVQKSGARYVRISSPEMLLEAVDLLVAEIHEAGGTDRAFRSSIGFLKASALPARRFPLCSWSAPGISFNYLSG